MEDVYPPIMLKFYETHFEEYLQATRACNLHPELEEKIEGFPKKWEQMNNMIIYGPPGIGKYSQALAMIRRYSPSELKYEKKITVQTEKQNYIYHISDIHYEIDMSLLGCNSKILWNEIFLQIVDIVSVKTEKIGIVMCKQFQAIHSELLDIFYSYIQQYNNVQSPIQLKFVILTEQLSFIPNNILGSCYIWNIERPCEELYKKALKTHKHNKTGYQTLPPNPQECEKAESYNRRVDEMIDEMEPDVILNIKELRSLALLKKPQELPKDIFNIICDNIIHEISAHDKKLDMATFRDTIYDILVYNLDIGDVLWYILSHFVKSHHLAPDVISEITTKIYTFLKYYNNNYRPIYHLESIFFYFIVKIYGHE